MANQDPSGLRESGHFSRYGRAKHPYATPEAALADNPGKTGYRCRLCGYWHVTSF